MKRGVYLLPGAFTVGSLVCGYFAILATLHGVTEMLTQGPFQDSSRLFFDSAGKALGWGVLLDGLDGRIARLTNSTSDFGREFDSLADVITFGVAPAFLAFAWGVLPAAKEDVVLPILKNHLPTLGWVVTFAFLICGAARLGRFNIMSIAATADKRQFVGLPIPAAAGVIAAVVHCRQYPVHDWDYSLIWLGLVAVLAFLMVSTVRYPSFKAIDLRRRRSYATVVLIGLAIYLTWRYSEYTLLVIAGTYAMSGPTARLISKFRPRPPAPTEVPAA
ncbi:MAG: CDP-diacylglycerol--serine O-phosphatidyltransferase [Terriglobia bacterium]